MKRRISLMILAGLIVGVADASEAPVPLVPLTVCNSGITQAYDGLSSQSSLTRADYNIHTSSDCTGLPDETIVATTGSLTLDAGTSSLRMCYSTTPGSLPTSVCGGRLVCQNSTCSFRLFQLETSTDRAFGLNGDCVSVTCSAGSPSSWALVSGGTLSFNPK